MIPSLIIAFAMYSKIPMPKTDWTPENMRYVMCFFPLVGVVSGALECLVFFLTDRAGFGPVMSAVLPAMVPVFISGSIHLDGFMDTMDARSSWGGRDKKLAILKDSHTGAFAILGCCVWMLLWTAAWGEISARTILSAALCFPFTRILSGLSVTVFQCAKSSGLAATFHSAAHKETVRRALTAELAVCCAVMILVHPLYGLVTIAAGLLMFLRYRHFSYRDFGGITGDLAGYFLCVAELLELLVLVLTAAIAG